jgi:hypothetical protein
LTTRLGIHDRSHPYDGGRKIVTYDDVGYKKISPKEIEKNARETGACTHKSRLGGKVARAMTMLIEGFRREERVASNEQTGPSGPTDRLIFRAFRLHVD